MDKSDQPLVSVACITYNHEAFIQDAIESFLMQDTNFPIEIVIHDDASTDRTSVIIREYEAKHPDKIIALYQSENQHSRGKKPFVSFVLPRCRGKYVAVCEGDDYWTDPHKLQKQVHFLESHPECSMCFHNVLRLYLGVDQEAKLTVSPDQKPFLEIEDLLRNESPIHTSSVLFRNGLVNPLPPCFSELMMGDWPMWVLLTQHGKAGYINETMSAYRIHSGGIWSGGNSLKQLRGWVQAYDTLDRHLDYKYHSLIETGKINCLLRLADGVILNATTTVQLKEIASTLPPLFAQHMNKSPELLHQLLGRLYGHCFFIAANEKDYSLVRHSFLKLLRYDRTHLSNLGAWSIVVESLIGPRIMNKMRSVIRRTILQ